MKPDDLFSGANPFIVDAHYFFPQLVDTLTYLPHVQSLEDELDNSDVQASVKKMMEVVQIFTRQGEFREYFTS